MLSNALGSLSGYSQFVANLTNRPSIKRSTLTIWSDSPFTGIAEGEIFFANGFRLRLHEELDFDEEIITSYGYEVYQGGEKLYWYDDFPHPNDPTLASTHPHHKHIPPNIKRHRVPAPDISFHSRSTLSASRDRGVNHTTMTILIKNGTIITASDTVQADVLIEGERVVHDRAEVADGGASGDRRQGQISAARRHRCPHPSRHALWRHYFVG